MTESIKPPNPYVGPVTFTHADRNRYFGREREARDLLSVVIAERLTLFYAQSGAGKSSLLNTRLIPGLRQQARYLVLPVGRVGGEMPQDVPAVDNIYAFNLMLSLDRHKLDADPNRFAHLTLPAFLDGLHTADGLYYEYDEATAQRAAVRRTATASPTTTQLNSPNARNQPPHVLIIDQFEEIITAHPHRWRERYIFFQQLADAMRADPLLWVVLTLREDFVAPLDPFAELLPGRLSTRFYMERMGIDAALTAIKRPAADAGRPFKDEAAQTLVDNLCQVRVVGQEGTFPGQYVEPVQLQVVCYQLWKNLNEGRGVRGGERVMEHGPTGDSSSSFITIADLQQSGDVDTALADFYEQAIRAALALPDVQISERQLRTWFDKQLITDANTRGTIYRGAEETAGMSNRVVDALQARFLLRTELRAGGAWIELVHDRFVRPIRRANAYWPLRRHGKDEYIFLAPGHALNLPPAPPLTADRNPYRGLQPYHEAHAKLFFGRTVLIKQLATRVQSQPLTVVLGASGTGKSSLVKAGLAPYLKQSDSHPPFHILTPLRPGDMPLRLLADLLARELNDGTIIQPTSTAIVQSIKQWLALHVETTLLLIIDQFEELITLCRDESECAQFLALLAELVHNHGARVHLVLTLRTDFEPQFTDSPLASYWHTGDQTARFVVPPPTQAELREVIEEPAAQRMLFFDPAELVDQLVDEVSQTPGALSLLSFTLSELYLKYLKRQEEAQRRGKTIERSLTEVDYRALGGVIGSLGARANEVYDGLDSAHQMTMQRVMLRMVALEGDELVRRRVPVSELQYQAEDENRRVATIINQMVEARLLLYGSGADINGDNLFYTYIEPAHDALVRAWDKLLLWKQAANEYLPLQRRLTRASQEWRHAPAENKAALLWDHDPGLPQVLPDITKQADLLSSILNPGQLIWSSTSIEQMPRWLNKLETEFIAASVKQRATLRRRVTLITATVFLGLLGLTIYAFILNGLAQRRADESQSLALAARAQQAIQNQDHDLAIALALQANTITDPPELAINALAAAAYVPGTKAYFDRHHDQIIQVALSADGHTALSAALDQQVLLWDVETQAIRHQLTAPQVISITQVAYSPRGETALLGTADGSITVWDLNTGAIRQRLTAGYTGTVTALTYSADGQTALAGDSNGILTLWDIDTGQLIRPLGVHPNGASAVALSPDGQTALSGGYDAKVMLWDLADGQVLHQIEELHGQVIALAYDPTARYMMAGSTDYAVRAWNITTGQRIGGVNLQAHTQDIGSIAIAPDGVTVAFGAWDGSIRLWDLQVNAAIGALVGHRAPAISLAFSQDSRYLLSGSRDSTIRLWDIRGPTQLRPYSVEPRLTGGGPQIDTVNNLALDPNQHRVLSGARGVAIVWNYDTGQETRRLPLNNTPSVARNGVVFQVKAYDPAVGNQDGDGIARVELSIRDAIGKTVYTHEEKFAAYCAFGGDVQVCDPWDFAQADYHWPGSNGQPGEPIDSGQYTLRAIIYAEDGESMTQEQPLTIQLAERDNPSPLLTEAAVTPADSPSTAEASVLVAQVTQAGMGSTRLSAVALSPDGQQALISDGSNLIRWDLTTDEKSLLPRGHTRRIANVAYLPDGQTAFSTDEAGVVIAWQVASGQQRWRRPLAYPRLWSIAFTHDGRQAVAGYEDRSVILWDLETSAVRWRFTGHQDAVYWVTISPDESKLLTGSADRRVILWDLASGQEIRRFEGHSLPVRAVAFSPDGRTLLSGGEDQTVRLWNAETGAEIFRFEGHTAIIQNVLYLPSGAQFLSRANDGGIILWQLPPPDLVDMIAWTYDNRYVRPLTCAERLLYNVKPLCQGK